MPYPPVDYKSLDTLDDHEKTKENKPSQPQPQFNFKSLLFLLGLVTLAEALGIVIPGPIDDFIYQALAVSIYGGFLTLKDFLYRRK